MSAFPIAAPVLLVLAVLSAPSAPPPLPRGNDHFRLGMSRAQVDSAVAARRLAVISSGGAHLVCASSDPAAEYEQYSFFQGPHGMVFLWKVTVGYRLGASPADLDPVFAELSRQLGPPASDSGAEPGPASAAGAPPPPSARQVIWADPLTAVQLGARWNDGPPHPADRMMVTWTDRRLQRLVEARRRQGRPEGKD